MSSRSLIWLVAWSPALTPALPLIHINPGRVQRFLASSHESIRSAQPSFAPSLDFSTVTMSALVIESWTWYALCVFIVGCRLCVFVRPTC